MHPDVCRFISEAFYEGRLEPRRARRGDCARHGAPLPAGRALRHIARRRTRRRQDSREEIERLLGAPWSTSTADAPLAASDVLVVAPYNAQVHALREALPDRACRVGTVDKFQGQEAPVVFFSMASSSGEDVPRGLEFLLSRNRLNVAISRAHCLAYLVASPRLLEVDCRTIQQMRLANALCRFVELAAPPS